MAKILLAKPVRDKYIPQLQDRCKKLIAKGIHPSLKVILVGKHPPSIIYTKNKKTFFEKLGMLCEIIHLEENTSKELFLSKISEITKDKSVHGCFVQLPLPQSLDKINVKQLIPPAKDVDGFHQDNVMKMLIGDSLEVLESCTPKGIMTMLDFYNINPTGKHVVIIGRSMIVGKPMMLLLNNANATVTLCHSMTDDIAFHTKQADIIITAVGKAKFLTSEYFNKDKSQTVIDVGMNHDEQGKLCGDVDFANVKNIVKCITPVPGGVGPMTIFSLAQNLLQAAEKTI